MVVKFQYDAEQPDELTLRVGDIIKNCKVVEDGWMKGELNGKWGIFPDNYVVKKKIAPPPGLCVCMNSSYMCCVVLYCVYMFVYR